MKLAVSNVPPDHTDRITRALVEEGLVACVNLLATPNGEPPVVRIL